MGCRGLAVMVAPAIISSITTFCHSWGDMASVAGLIVSIVGFVITICGVVAAKDAAQQAEAAAKQAKERILKYQTIANFSTAIAAMEDVIRLIRKEEWGIVLDRQFNLSKLLV